jgi:hypothetical protein
MKYHFHHSIETAMYTGRGNAMMCANQPSIYPRVKEY